MRLSESRHSEVPITLSGISHSWTASKNIVAKLVSVPPVGSNTLREKIKENKGVKENKGGK